MQPLCHFFLAWFCIILSNIYLLKMLMRPKSDLGLEISPLCTFWLTSMIKYFYSVIAFLHCLLNVGKFESTKNIEITILRLTVRFLVKLCLKKYGEVLVSITHYEIVLCPTTQEYVNISSQYQFLVFSIPVSCIVQKTKTYTLFLLSYRENIFFSSV